MPQQFVNQLEQVCRRRRRRSGWTANCWAVAALLIAALLLMGLDRLLGVADVLGRTVLTLVLVTCGLLILRRWLLVRQKNRVTPLQVAQEVEQQHPELRDVVSSAWEFTQQSDDDPTAGSDSLRRAVVLRAAASEEAIDWSQLTPKKPLLQSLLALVCTGAVLAALAGFLPQALPIGFARLLNPLSTAEWPRDCNLQFVETPTLLARGEDLVLQLQNSRGPLPTAITVHYRIYRNGRWQVEVQPLLTTNNSLEIRRSNVQESLQYRATGADHQTMPWQPLEVLAPPQVVKLEVTVHPPAYTELPTQVWDPTTLIYAGSNLELHGELDQRAAQVVLRTGSGQDLEATLDEDGLRFLITSSAWRLDQSASYSIEITTVAGLLSTDSEKLLLPVVEDQPPVVRFAEPLEDLTVLPTVMLPLVIEARDELAVREIELVFSRSDHPQQDEQRQRLWNASGQGATEGAKKQRVDYSWDLKSLELTPGSMVTVYVEATDAQPATGRSVRALQLKIVSEDQLWQQLVEQQTQIAETLTQLLREQRALRELTAVWEELPAWSNQRWTSASHTALFRQRQVLDALADGKHSVLGQMSTIVQAIERNRLLRPAAVERLRAAQGVLQDLGDGALVTAEQSLSELARQVRRSKDRSTLLLNIIATADSQEQSIAGLRSVIELLLPGNVLGRLERELALLETDQLVLAEDCRVKITPLLLGGEDNKKDLKTALSSAVRRQRALVRRFSELLREMAQAAEQVTDDEWGSAARLAETVALAEELGVQVTIQSAVDQLLRHRLGRSTTLQQQTLKDIAQLRARLAGKDAAGIAKRFEVLQTAERQLKRLRRKLVAHEEELRKLTDKQRQRELERLRRERKKLAEQAEVIARKLEHLRLPKAVKATKQAASQLRRAKLDTEFTKQARKKLDVAQRQITNARRRQQVVLARLEMAQLDAKLGVLVERQKTIQQEVLRLASLEQHAGKLSNAQRQSILLLVDRQVELREQTIGQAEQLTSLPVFAHLLKLAGVTMEQVERHLQQAELEQPTQILVTQAVAQLSQLAAAVRQQQKELAAENADDKPNEGGAGQGEKQGDTAQSQTLQLALGQLQLLKELQIALQEKTEALEAQQSMGQTSVELARQQQQLAELAQELVPEPPDPPSEDLLPDLDEELESAFDDLLLPIDEGEN